MLQIQNFCKLHGMAQENENLQDNRVWEDNDEHWGNWWALRVCLAVSWETISMGSSSVSTRVFRIVVQCKTMFSHWFCMKLSGLMDPNKSP
jgi:hypothetical protein